MTLDMYQIAALEVRSYTDNKGVYPSMKLFSEAGEVADEIAKVLRYGLTEERKIEIAKELGDVLGSLSYVAADYGFSLQQIADIHLSKIKDRIENNNHKPFEKIENE